MSAVGEAPRRREPILKNGSTNGQEEGHDSGVDENTQSKDTCERTSLKNGRAIQRKRQGRSMDPAPIKSRISTASVERKLPMNKIEVGKSKSPNIKNIRSKIGSLDNTTHRPGGGNVKIENRKIDFSQTVPRLDAKHESYTPGGGQVKISNQKLRWNVSSKVGSLEKTDHKPGGGAKKVVTQKLNFKETAKSKVGSTDNITHKSGGGKVQIRSEKLEFKETAKSKVGSLDNVQHVAGGGDKKIFNDNEYLKQIQEISASHTPRKTSSGRTSEVMSPTTTGTNSPGTQDDDEESQD